MSDDKNSTRGFPLKIEPIALQRDAAADLTPADYAAGAAPASLPTPYWRCSTVLDHAGCGAIWLKERKVACPCGGYVARIEKMPTSWPKPNR